MLRSELDGEPATTTLPPPQPAAPRAGRVEHELATAFADRVDGIVPTFTLPAPSHLPAPLHAGAGRAVVTLPVVARTRAPSRHAWAQGLAAVALLVGGGWLWQTISTFATARSMQARFAAAATAVPAQAANARTAATSTQAGAATAPARAAAQDVVALADQAIARAPPGAGSPHAPVTAVATAATMLPAAAVDTRHVAADAATRQHAHAPHDKPRPRMLATAVVAAPASLSAACTLESETLGLCSHAPARAAVRAAPARAAAPAPVREPANEVVRPAPAAPAPACDPNRATLGLCPAGARTTP